MTKSIPHYPDNSAAYPPPAAKYQAILDKVPDIDPEPYDAIPNHINFNIGICGAHRTGKTTLAIALSKALNMPFVAIGTSELFAQHNIDPAKPMDFRTRIAIQNKVLDKAESIWFEMDEPFVCDRTPIDMVAYTMSEVLGNTLDKQLEQELLDYRVRCNTVLDRYFGALVLVPPAIPIVAAQGKASASFNYIEHIHLLCYSLFHRSSIQGYEIEWQRTNLDSRVADVKRYLENINVYP